MNRPNFVFISTMRLVRWGGSEALWYGAAKHLLASGCAVCTRTYAWNPVPAPLSALAKDGASVSFEPGAPPFWLRVVRRISPAIFQERWQTRIVHWLRTIHAPKVIISCGSLRDDFSALSSLARSGTPYVVLIQAAAPEIWPSDETLDDIFTLLTQARRVFFVCDHNREDVQQCLGTKLPNAEIVWNPVSSTITMETIQSLGFPPVCGELRLASVARLYVEAKGQDLLLRTLALPKWKERNVWLTLYGEGPQGKVLRNVARYLGLERVSFAGHVTDIAAIWSNHHLGILASRYEGMPLSLLEAMMFGRANIVTRVCGNPEIVDDNETGFIASAPAIEALDEALERAWNRRGDLDAMGRLAAKRIRKLVPSDPCRDLADKLLSIL